MLRQAIAGVFVAAALAAGQSGGEWRPLFDGKSLASWNESDFFGAGKVTVANGVVTLGQGALTGITWAGPVPFPAAGYEVRIEAARMKGSDFFAGITFPVRDSYCTWINGGWGGEVVGLSSIDGADASMNETTSTRLFEVGRWYTFRLRVTPEKVMTWIGDDVVVDLSIGKKWIALREGEIQYSAPFGIASYSTVAGIRRIEWRPLESAPK
jgi:hypothetical protein